MQLLWLVLLLFPFPAAVFFSGFEIFRYMSTGIIAAIEVILDLGWRFFPIIRIRRYDVARLSFRSVYGVMRLPFPVSPRAIKALRHFPCYFPDIAIYYVS